MTRKTVLPLILPLIVVAVSACAPKNFEALHQVASETTGNVGCSNFESKTWDSLQTYLQEQNSIPTSEELRDHLKLSLKNLKAPAESLTEENLTRLSQDLEKLFEILLSEAPQTEKTSDAQVLGDLLAALELGDHTSESRVQLQSHIESQFAKIKKQVAEMNVECTQPPAEESPGDKEGEEGTLLTGLPLPVYGMRFTFANAYQSCQVLDEPIMSSATVEISKDAIKELGNHEDGIGTRRIIASVDSLLQSHPYYKNVNNYGSSCVNARSFPMIYDYGGRPYPSTSSSSTLNLFKNAGSGTSVLGMDCSGYVYTGLATAGLRLKPGSDMKATGVKGINSRMFVEPQNNGMSCLSKITLTAKSDLRAGDIVAVPGHVLMIDSVGSDPFGINGVKTADECSKLEAKNFDFAVIQSSPSKNAVGMNRYEAKTYLYEADKMRVGLEKYAYYACLAKVNNKNYTPNLGTLSVIRHKLTSSCIGGRVKLTQESCVRSCPQLRK